MSQRINKDEDTKIHKKLHTLVWLPGSSLLVNFCQFREVKFPSCTPKEMYVIKNFILNQDELLLASNHLYPKLYSDLLQSVCPVRT